MRGATEAHSILLLLLLLKSGRGVFCNMHRLVSLHGQYRLTCCHCCQDIDIRHKECKFLAALYMSLTELPMIPVCMEGCCL
jgi:hypothetical protein